MSIVDDDVRRADILCYPCLRLARCLITRRCTHRSLVAVSFAQPTHSLSPPPPLPRLASSCSIGAERRGALGRRHAAQSRHDRSGIATSSSSLTNVRPALIDRFVVCTVIVVHVDGVCRLRHYGNKTAIDTFEPSTHTFPDHLQLEPGYDRAAYGLFKRRPDGSFVELPPTRKLLAAGFEAGPLSAFRFCAPLLFDSDGLTF
jgi:hypothetical protein